jgi:hypothetical protein
MKLNYSPFCTADLVNLSHLVHDTLLSQHGREFDGIKARHWFNERYGMDIDHHVFTDVMDGMTRTNEAVCTQPWGYTKYRIL